MALISNSFFSSLLLFLQHDENYIDVREYVIALSVVCKPAKTLETMKLAFKVHSCPFFQVLFKQWSCFFVYAKEDICHSSFLKGEINMFYVVSLHVCSIFNAQKSFSGQIV